MSKGNGGANKGKKYKKRDKLATNERVAKCGHVSKEGRWLKCEVCQPELPSDDGDLTYYQWGQDESEYNESTEEAVVDLDWLEE